MECEYDTGLTHESYSCSIKAKSSVEEVGDVIRNERRLTEILSAKQLSFLRRQGFKQAHREYGFGRAQKSEWKIATEFANYPVKLEHWQLDRKAMLLEVSMRVSADDRMRALTWLHQWTTIRNVTFCDHQESKTLTLLKFFKPQ